MNKANKLHPAYVRATGKRALLGEPHKGEYTQDYELDIGSHLHGCTPEQAISKIRSLVKNGFIGEHSKFYNNYESFDVELEKPFFDEEGYARAVAYYEERRDHYNKWMESVEGKKAVLKHDLDALLTKLRRNTNDLGVIIESAQKAKDIQKELDKLNTE